jgi:hypothetical protein
MINGVFALRVQTGRLVELWLEAPVTRQDADGVGAQLRAILSARSDKLVVATELVLTKTLPPEVSEAFIGLMRADNPRVERSGFLIADDAATFALQLERMIKEAASSSRRVFRNPAEWQAWVAELLTPDEARRLRAFAAERAAAAAAARGRLR